MADGLEHLLQGERCRLSARQSWRAAAGGLLGIALVAAVCWPDVPATLLLGWAILLGGTLALRAVAARRFLRSGDAVAPGALVAILEFAAGLSGLLAGAAATLFFPHLDATGMMLVTIVSLGWLAGSVGAFAGYPRHFHLHALAMLGQLVLSWWLSDAAGRHLIAASLALYGLLLAAIASDLGAMILSSLRTRLENQSLAARLARESRSAQAANRAKSNFLAAASHDLRQPATSLSLLVSVLRERVSDDALMPAVLGIERSVSTLTDLLEDLLDLSRLDAGVVEPRSEWVPLPHLVGELAEEFRPRAAERGLALHARAAPGALRCDPVLAGRLLRNLLDNAVRYTEQGWIAIECSARDGLSITVADTGVGIPAEHREQIFDEYFQIANPQRDRSRGLGIGLAIVRRIAALLGASVAVHSVPGAGSRFTVSFPPERYRAETAAAARNDAEADSRPPGSLPACVLLVEDDASVREAVTQLLRAWRCDVTSAASVEEALEALESDRQFDLVLSDYRLPGQRDGLDLLGRVRSARPSVACMLATGDTGPDVLRRAALSGFPVLHKPLSAERLALTMASALEQAGLGDVGPAERAAVARRGEAPELR